MVLDTKKGLLKADKKKGQYVDSEKGNDKEKRKKIFFYIMLTLEHRKVLRSSANQHLLAPAEELIPGAEARGLAKCDGLRCRRGR
jgi:hypothetical protein